MFLIAELRRRNVLRVGAAYLVAAWLLIQVAETLFPLFGLPDTAARIVVIVLGIGLIPTLVLAWAFKLTPQGVRKESDADASSSFSPAAGRRLDRVIMVVLAVALGYFAFDRFVLGPQREAVAEARKSAELDQARQQGRSEALIDAYGDQSIVVLPFVNMSDDAGNEYFSDGITEELLNLLARVPGLRVISRTSAFSYKGKDVRLTQVADELNVAHVLEGSVRKAGSRVRITAQLIEARSDSHLWSQTWDLALDDIFAIQEQIAAQVAEHLKVRLLGQPLQPVETDPQAYALYLQARYLGGQGGAEPYREAITLLEQALAIDPAYAAAWDGLASVYINQASKGLRDWQEGFSRAREASARALEIDPRFAPAHARLGWVAMLFQNDLAQAARHYQRALELAPTNARIIGDAASLLKSLGRLDECIKFDEYVVARDPVNAVGHFNLGGSYLYAGRWDDALAAWQTALRLSPNRIGAHYQIGIVRLFKAETEAALASFEQEPLEVLKLLGRAMAQHALGDVEASNRALTELIDGYSRDAAYNIAYVMAFRGEADRAFEWLGKAIEYGDPGLSEIAVEPLFGNIVSDPRWLPLLESIGKSPTQLDAIEFKVTLPPVASFLPEPPLDLRFIAGARRF